MKRFQKPLEENDSFCRCPPMHVHDEKGCTGYVTRFPWNGKEFIPMNHPCMCRRKVVA